MIFDDLLKEFENGANSRVIAEKLFETFQHHEITPILKEIQYIFLSFSLKNVFKKKENHREKHFSQENPG